MSGRQHTPGGVWLCDICGKAPGATLNVRGTQEVLCPRCVTTALVWKASTDHLSTLLTAAYTQWLDQWEDNPEYRRDWDELHSKLMDAVDILPLVTCILTERRIFPRRGRMGHR